MKKDIFHSVHGLCFFFRKLVLNGAVIAISNTNMRCGRNVSDLFPGNLDLFGENHERRGSSPAP